MLLCLWYGPRVCNEILLLLLLKQDLTAGTFLLRCSYSLFACLGWTHRGHVKGGMSWGTMKHMEGFVSYAKAILMKYKPRNNAPTITAVDYGHTRAFNSGGRMKKL